MNTNRMKKLAGLNEEAGSGDFAKLFQLTRDAVQKITGATYQFPNMLKDMLVGMSIEDIVAKFDTEAGETIRLAGVNSKSKVDYISNMKLRFIAPRGDIEIIAVMSLSDGTKADFTLPSLNTDGYITKG